MFLLLLLITCTSSIYAQPESKWLFKDDAETKSEKLGCILPPQPRNGHYKVTSHSSELLSPGDSLSNYTLEVTCDPGYHHTESYIHFCFNGDSLWEMTECLPYCSNEVPRILSCGAGVTGEETRCLVQKNLFDVSIRGLEMHTLGCGRKNDFVPFISGGRKAQEIEVPWHAGIYTKKKQPYKQICGGSLVSETVVISAAHCFWSDTEKQLPASNYAVAVGKIYRPWNDEHDEKAQKSDVAEIRIPPRFQGSATNLQDDIALVIVSTPFTYTTAVKPVCLDFDVSLDAKQTAPGQEGQVAGWGLTSENGPESPVLKVVEMPIVAIDECIDKSDPAFRVHITSDKICAGYHNGTAVCKGDSGGGLSFPEKDSYVTRYFLRGVVSAAPSSENLCNTLAWATFTYVLRHQHFIRETVPAESPTSN